MYSYSRPCVHICHSLPSLSPCFVNQWAACLWCVALWERKRERQEKSGRMKREPMLHGCSVWKSNFSRPSWKDNGTCRNPSLPLWVISRNKYVRAVGRHGSTCSSYFHGCCALTPVMGHDCVRGAAGPHHHALWGFRAAFAPPSMLVLTVFGRPAAVSVDWVHLVRLGETGGRCSRRRTLRKWGIEPAWD